MVAEDVLLPLKICNIFLQRLDIIHLALGCSRVIFWRRSALLRLELCFQANELLLLLLVHSILLVVLQWALRWAYGIRLFIFLFFDYLGDYVAFQWFEIILHLSWPVLLFIQCIALHLVHVPVEVGVRREARFIVLRLEFDGTCWSRLLVWRCNAYALDSRSSSIVIDVLRLVDLGR